MQFEAISVSAVGTQPGLDYSRLFVSLGAGVVRMENKKFTINLDDSAFNRERSPVSGL